jgi:hypothetical protein
VPGASRAVIGSPGSRSRLRVVLNEDIMDYMCFPGVKCLPNDPQMPAAQEPLAADGRLLALGKVVWALLLSRDFLYNTAEGRSEFR